MNSDLTKWLETATQNLAPAAKAWVCEQLLEHYAAALEQHQPKPNAEALALADLIWEMLKMLPENLNRRI